MTNKTDCREAFEKFAKSKGWETTKAPHDADGLKKDDYLKPFTERAWLAWQEGIAWNAATQPPTDAQRQAALNDLEVLKNGWDEDQIDVSGKFVQLHYETVKAALQSPAVPRELSDAINKAADRKSYTWTKEYVGNRDFENEGAISLAKNLQTLLGGKEG